MRISPLLAVKGQNNVGGEQTITQVGDMGHEHAQVLANEMIIGVNLGSGDYWKKTKVYFVDLDNLTTCTS